MALTPTSHAQYGEDLILWRALSDIDGGFYIDVGAAHPVQESVTKLFYDRGWSGINLEPRWDGWATFVQMRPRDINLKLAASNRFGVIELVEVQNQPGLSTAKPSLLPPGLTTRRVRALRDTLARVCEQHVTGDIHFLKIDVEGMEREVLEGCDFVRFRPWVLAIEACYPCTTDPSHAEWEEIVLSAGYEFALFETINRYYVAAEHVNRKRWLAGDALGEVVGP